MPGSAIHNPRPPLAQTIPGGPPEERQALYMFRTEIATSIASIFDLEFWTHDLLQTAEAYQTVQHAVAALATAYHSSILSENGCKTQERQFILTQYNKSMSSLQHCLSNPELTRAQQVIILMVNLVFIFICAVQGFQKEACLHLRNGLALFHGWHLGAGEGHGPESMPTSVKLLATLYTQLDTQARIIMESNSPHKMRLWPSHSVVLDGWGSGHLATITKAASQLERLHNAYLQLTTPSGSSDNERLFHHSHMALVDELQTWDANFGRLLSQGGIPIKYLQIRRLLTGVIFELWHKGASKAPESNPTWAKSILELVNEMMQDSRFSKARVVFTPAGGLVEALYFVATRCYDTGVKRVAIEMLERHPIIEGLWNNSMAHTAVHKHHATW
ncbi:hypothetical protein CEP53_000005 [Fusarium sp. AF-6]|nr:hypothetical protein CEP53_000005 [Fusarium sp. AF-6]